MVTVSAPKKRLTACPSTRFLHQLVDRLLTKRPMPARGKTYAGISYLLFRRRARATEKREEEGEESRNLPDGTLRRQEPFHRECFYVTGTRLSYLHKRLLLSSS